MWQRIRPTACPYRLWNAQPQAAATAAALIGSDSDAAVSGLDHVVIRTPNPERAVALYAGRLGLSLRLDRSEPSWGARLLFFRCGDLVIEVAHDLKAGVSDEPDRLWGLSWRVPDIARAHARVKAAGIEVSDIRDRSPPRYAPLHRAQPRGRRADHHDRSGQTGGGLKGSFLFGAGSVVAIQMPANTAIKSDEKHGRDRLTQQGRREQPGNQRIDGHGVGDARGARVLQRIHPQEKRERPAAGRKIEGRDPVARTEPGKAATHHPCPG